MKQMMNLIILLLSLSLLMIGCPPPCSTKIVGHGTLAGAPPPVSIAEDPQLDLILDHPLFEENFDVVYRSYDMIPIALDIVRVELRRDERNYYFRVSTAGDNVPELLREKNRSALFGIFVDTDLNGISDFLLTTTDNPERGVVVAPNFDLIEEMPSLSIDSTSVTISASINTLGDHFEWVAFTGYSPAERSHYHTPLEGLFIVPIVDMAYADTARTVLLHTTLSGTGQQCQVTDMGITRCPPPDNPPGRQNVPGAGCEGWMLRQKRCGNLKIELWCYCCTGGPPWSGGAFGKRVEKDTNKGWIARCPFSGGQNSQDEQDADNDRVPDKVTHTVVDGGSDDDHDGYKDVMIYEYDFDTNRVTITNIERDYNTGAVVNTKILPGGSVPPYSNPKKVPGNVD